MGRLKPAEIYCIFMYIQMLLFSRTINVLAAAWFIVVCNRAHKRGALTRLIVLLNGENQFHSSFAQHNNL